MNGIFDLCDKSRRRFLIVALHCLIYLHRSRALDDSIIKDELLNCWFLIQCSFLFLVGVFLTICFFIPNASLTYSKLLF